MEIKLIFMICHHCHIPLVQCKSNALFFPSINLTVPTHKSSILLSDAFIHSSLFFSYCHSQNFMLLTLLKLFSISECENLQTRVYKVQSKLKRIWKTQERGEQWHSLEISVCSLYLGPCQRKEKPVCTRKGEKLCDLEEKLTNSALK